jgi:hypothetical protein
MEQVFQAVIDRTRTPLDLDQVKTIFGYKKRPWRTKLSEGRYEAAIEKPGYSLTVFKVHYGKLTLKIYTKGESTLRIEVVVHNTLELPRCRPLERFANVIERLRAIIEKFLETVHSIDVCFVADATLEQLPTATRVGKSKVGGIDYNQAEYGSSCKPCSPWRHRQKVSPPPRSPAMYASRALQGSSTNRGKHPTI